MLKRRKEKKERKKADLQAQNDCRCDMFGVCRSDVFLLKRFAVDRGKCSESTVVTEICLTKISPFRTETPCLSNF